MPKRLVMLLLVLAVSTALLLVARQRQAARPGPRDSAVATAAHEWAALEEQEAAADRTVWAKERLAERCGAALEKVWDTLNASSNQLESLTAFPVRVTLPALAPVAAGPHGLHWQSSTGPGESLSPEAWVQRLRSAKQEGWQLEQVEFRHEQFTVDAHGRPERSRFFCQANLSRRQQQERLAWRGDLWVAWSQQTNSNNHERDIGYPAIDHIDASQLSLVARSGTAPFTPWFQTRLQPPPGSYFIDPLILRDLDGDGLSEIILVSANRVFHRQADGSFSNAPLCEHGPGLVFTAVMEDFDGDGFTDLLVARFEGLVLFRGSSAGRFDQPGHPVWAATPHLRYGQVLSCGDVDGDGDLDVWLGQYRAPYEKGQMAAPYYDARDGHPSYLLRNDGQGHFTDVTEAAGLGPVRTRRIYSASLVDLDRSGTLDLVVVSDFAGVEFWSNDGQGHFIDRTEAWAPVRQGFGMAHVLADFDVDGRADFLMMGMRCATPQRLEGLGLRRPGFPQHEAMRARMVEGNRLFQGREGGGFTTSSLNASMARSGWSWGCAAADFDNDGFPDVYITNGHDTRQRVRDYETEFWLHDIYVARSEGSPALRAFFQKEYEATRGQGWSYGGWEKNRLFLNQDGRSFQEVGHLFGVACEQDSRAVGADDLDGDGRVDLIFTTFEVWPEPRQTLQVWRNGLDSGHWLGLRLRSGRGRAPVGAEVEVSWAGRKAGRPLITGDSHRTQQAPVLRFGLGASTQADRVEIRWPGGGRTVLTEVAADRLYDVAWEAR